MGSETTTPPTSDGGKEFFARKAKSLVPPSFFEEVAEIEEELDKYTKSEVIGRYLSIQTKSVKIEPYDLNKFLVKTEVAEASKKGYVSPSMFVKYRRCARELALEVMESGRLGGVLVTPEQLKAYLKGLLAHRLFYDKYALGDKEVRVESPNLGILGYIDEVRKELDTYKVIEVKSSFKPDVVGAGLQVMSYIYAFADQNGVPPEQVEGYLITREGTYRILLDKATFSEYMKRLKKVVEIAEGGKVDDLPPRLSARLSFRCEVCPYRGLCLTLPDKYRSYDRFFEAMGFKKLAERKNTSSLDKFF